MKNRVVSITVALLVLVGVGYYLADYISSMAAAKRIANEQRAENTAISEKLTEQKAEDIENRLTIAQSETKNEMRNETKIDMVNSDSSEKDELIAKLRLEIKTLEQKLEQPSTKVDSTINQTQMIQQIKTIKKPERRLIYECIGYSVGGWEIPELCSKGLKEKITKESLQNSIAIELAPIVDSTPYLGPSSELKQEGLATYRAKSVKNELQNSAAEQLPMLQGATIQEANTRGFKLYCYDMRY